MRDVDDGFFCDVIFAAGHEEGAALPAEGVHHCADFVLVLLDDLAQLAELHRPPNAAVMIHLLGERLEEFLGDPAVLVGGQFGVDLVGVAAERLVHPAGGLVMVKVERTIRAALVPMIPRAHESVLKDGQLVGIVADVVEQPLDEAGGDLALADSHRPLNGLPALVSV